MRIKPFLWGLIAACLLLAPALMNAQDYRGRIQGTVMDNSDAVLPAATVTLVNTKTGVSTVRKSNDVGHYIFDYVEPGDYQLLIESNGFAKFTQRNISVQARSDVRVDAILKPGASDQTIVVESAPVAVQFDTATLSTTIDQKMANDLPSLGRSPFLLASLDPSV